MKRRLLVASVLALLLLSACGGAATESAPAADQTTAEQAPAENTDTQAAESTDAPAEESTAAPADGSSTDASLAQAPTKPGAPLIVMLADAVTLTDFDGAKVVNDDFQTTYTTDMTAQNALGVISAAYIAAGYTESVSYLSDEADLSFERREYAKAAGAAGDFVGNCSVLVRKAKTPDRVKSLGTDKVNIVVACVKL